MNSQHGNLNSKETWKQKPILNAGFEISDIQIQIRHRDLALGELN